MSTLAGTVAATPISSHVSIFPSPAPSGCEKSGASQSRCRRALTKRSLIERASHTRSLLRLHHSGNTVLQRLHCTVDDRKNVVELRSKAAKEPPLWSSGQSSWLQIQRSGFDSRRYQIFWEVVGLERSPLGLVSTVEELLGRNKICCGLGKREYGLRDPSRWPPGTLYPQKLTLTSPKSDGRCSSLANSGDRV
jgi:hypothetical protein